MSADGAWPDSPAEPPVAGADEAAHDALGELRMLVSQMEGWLVSLEATSLRAATAADLARSVEALGRRVDAGDAPDLAAKLSELAQRLKRQLQEARDLSEPVAAAAPLVPAQHIPAKPARPRSRPRVLLTAGVAVVVGAATAVAIVGRSPAMGPRGRPEAAASPPQSASAPPPAPAQAAGTAVVNPVVPRSAGAAPPAPASHGRDLEAVFKALEGGDARAVPQLMALAQRGNPVAQLQVAQLYEAGGPGIAPDLTVARDWTRRAADGGDRIAMHNLALFLLNGDGGPRDVPQAARWFRKAANLGVVDSQHNMGLLYESGLGVEKNLREAYRWFTIAANAGDGASREKAVELEARLTGRERAGVDTEVQSFRPGGASLPTPETMIIPPATTLSATQALLARAGYYVGPTDGTASPALRAAAAAYLKDHPDVGAETSGSPP